jgi:hypothetical protein
VRKNVFGGLAQIGQWTRQNVNAVRRASARACVHARVCVCVRACVRACVRV